MSEPPRSLADDLRSRSDESLAGLLRRRPDLTTPLPSDLGQLAARSHTAGSTTRALDRLDAFSLQVLDVVAVLPEPVDADQVPAWLPGAEPRQVVDVVDDLWLLGLLWGDRRALRPTTTVRDVLGPTPAGLGPWRADLSSAAPTPTDTELDALLASAPDGALAALDQLVWGPPQGTVARADRIVSAAEASTPVDWLLATGLLVATDGRTVVLPREVGLHLRGGRVHREVVPAPPAPQSTRVDPVAVDRAAAGSAFELVRRVENLAEAWSVDPPPLLRSGGLGVRDLRTAAAALDVTEGEAALLVELSHQIGLLAAGDDDTWQPTPEYDVWRTQPPARRWLDLVAAWLDTTRVVGLVGSKDAKGGRVNALGPELDRAVAPEVRRAVLADLGHQEPGTAVSETSLSERQAWRRPRRGTRLRSDLVGWALREGSQLGMVALGAVPTAARHLLGSDEDAALDALAGLLPTPVRHVVLQADLTAVAPGPLDTDVAREFSLMSDVESGGGATVFRFSERSVRRALDAGRSGADVMAFLAAHSRTPVPQPLHYLVEDVSRRHGRLRVGPASSYLRCDDPAVLDEVMADRRTSGLRLRRLAPTVVAAGAPAETVLDQVRRIGLFPAAETAEGAVLVRRPDARRTALRRRPERLVAEPPVPAEAVLVAAVRALRSAELGGARGAEVVGPAAAGDVPRTAVGETLDLLGRAVARGGPVLLGYVGTDGLTAERVVDPVEVRGGLLTAYDHRTEQVRTFSLHRIAGVALLDPAPTDSSQPS
jgi:hypothetical protein